MLAASIFHFGEHTVAEAKAVMAARGHHRAHCVAVQRMTRMTQMEYRRLGRTGIKVSVLSFGSWVTFDTQMKDDLAMECMQAAHDAGCNFFDNAEVYAGGESEAIMGRVLDRARLAALVVRADDEGVLGHPRRPEHAQHAEPQVPDARHRRLAGAARASTSSTSSTATAPIPTRRSRRRCGR